MPQSEEAESNADTASLEASRAAECALNMRAIYMATAGSRTEGCTLLLGLNHCYLKAGTAGGRTLLYDIDPNSAFGFADKFLSEASDNVLVHATKGFHTLTSNGSFKFDEKTHATSGTTAFFLTGRK